MAVKTYAVGVSKTVRRLDDHTLPWVDVSITGGEDSTLFDVMTDPEDASKVIAVGTFFGPGTRTGIMVSDDAGATWNEPGGNWIGISIPRNGRRFYEVWFVDSNTIWVVADTALVALSTDGGATFNYTNAFPFNPLYQTGAIHAVSNRDAIVTGSFGDLKGNDVEVSITNDGGDTWTTLSGSPLPQGPTQNPNLSGGVWMSDDLQRIIVSTDNGHFLSTDGGATFVPKIPDADNGLHLTWYPDYGTPTKVRHVGGGQFAIANTDDLGNTWSTVRAEINLNGAHFYEENVGYYLEGSDIYHTTDGGATGTLSDQNAGISNLFAVWTGAEAEIVPCWTATNCENENETVRIQFEDPEYSPNTDLIYQFEEFGDACFSLVVNSCTEGVDPITIVTVSSTSDTCENCTGTCYMLTDCESGEMWLVNNTFFAAYVGRVLEITRLGNTGELETRCIRVALAACVGTPDEFAFTYVDCWDTCEECEAAQVEPEVPSTAVPITNRTVKPGWNPKGCSPEYVEKISCNFAEAMYQEAMTKRYGIEFCCNEEKDKWLIKYELLELKAIEDPEACQTIECCPPCNLEAEINYVCPPATGVIARITQE